MPHFFRKVDTVDNIIKNFNDIKIDAMLLSYPNNIFYFSWFKGSAGELFITKDKTYLITDFRYISQAKIQTNNIEIIDIAEGEKAIFERLIKNHCIKNVGFEGKYITYNKFLKIRSIFEDCTIISVENLVENFRMVKTENELLCLKKSAEIADYAFEKVQPLIKAGMTELEVAAMLEYEMKSKGATSTSFETIVASGKRSALPHGTASDKVINNGEFVVLDFGSIYNGYCSDITRTVAVGDVSDKMIDIYNKVLKVQEACLLQVKEDECAKNIDLFAREMFKEWEIDKFFGHSLGHGVGLDVHEMPNLSKISDVILEKNMIVTVEPGIYFEDEFGVRIEDSVLVDGGAVRLTKSSKELRFCK